MYGWATIQPELKTNAVAGWRLRLEPFIIIGQIQIMEKDVAGWIERIS